MQTLQMSNNLMRKNLRSVSKFLLKPLCLVMLLIIISCGCKAQFYFAISFDKNIDSLYYKSTATWVIPLPLFVTKQEFSMDEGKTYLRPRLFGKKLEGYVENIPSGKKQLRNYKTARVLGLIQMTVLPIIFVIKESNRVNEFNRKYQPPYPEDTEIGYMPYVGGFFLTGGITYHFIAKAYFRKSLKEYYKFKKL